jgi:membrane protein required for colicin V production
MNFNVFDIIFAIILLYSAYKGFSKGFVIQAATLVALLLGIYGAVRFSDYTADILSLKLNITTQYLPLIAFAVTFVAIVILVHLIAGVTEKLLRAVALGFVNRVAGLLFGVLKSAFIISILLVIVNGIDTRMNIIPSDVKNNSLLYRPLSEFAPKIFPFLKFQQIREGENNNPNNEIVT